MCKPSLLVDSGRGEEEKKIIYIGDKEALQVQKICMAEIPDAILLFGEKGPSAQFDAIAHEYNTTARLNEQLVAYM